MLQCTYFLLRPDSDPGTGFVDQAMVRRNGRVSYLQHNCRDIQHHWKQLWVVDMACR